MQEAGESNLNLNFALDLSLPCVSRIIHPVDALLPAARASNWRKWYQTRYYRRRAGPVGFDES